MKTILKAPLFNPNLFLPVAADLSKAKSNYACDLEDLIGWRSAKPPTPVGTS